MKDDEKSSSEVNGSNSNINTSQTAIEKTLLKILSPQTRKKGLALYHILEDSCKEISWDNNGVVNINGKEIIGSNIIDIIINLVSHPHKKNLMKPVGFLELLPYLKKLNIPYHLISNKTRLNELMNFTSPLNSEVAISMDKSIIEDNIYKTPTGLNKSYKLNRSSPYDPAIREKWITF